MEGIALAVDHLYSLGHRKIAFLNGSKNSMVVAHFDRSVQHELAHVGADVARAVQTLGDRADCYAQTVSDIFDCCHFHTPYITRASPSRRSAEALQFSRSFEMFSKE